MKVQMFGSFAMQTEYASINDQNNRSKKLWILISYLIFNRDRQVSLNELILVLKNGQATVFDTTPPSQNPVNATKTLIHRARLTLDNLYPGHGKYMILRRGNTYCWNTDYVVDLDVDEFERLYQEGVRSKSRQTRVSAWLSAAELYQGPFLAPYRSEVWVSPVTTRYQTMYETMVKDLLALLEEDEDWATCDQICRRAMQWTPYSSDILLIWLRALLHMDQQEEVIRVYESASRDIRKRYGLSLPNEVVRIYHEAMQKRTEIAVSFEMLNGQLKEDPLPGAMICDFESFRMIYRSLARMVIRNGDTVHLALLSLVNQNSGQPLKDHSLSVAMEKLSYIVQNTLRKGDVAAPCSSSQLVVLLPQANYENALMVCDRLTAEFEKASTRTAAKLKTDVFPMESYS